MEIKLDNQNGGAVPDGLKPLAVPGLGVDSVNVEGLLKNRNELLTENKGYKDRLEKLEQAEKLRQETEAKKRGDFESLLKDREEKLIASAKENKQLKIASRAVAEYELVDPDAVVLFMGQVSEDMANLGEVMATLKQAKPWLFKMLTTAPVVVTPTDKSKAPSPVTPGHIFTRAEIADPGVYRTNKDAILDQLRRGLIK